ncbi:pilus assembly protein TadG-related protein [Evansella tamaricis]|uniref:Tad domain-containing protein n=1 Tax=Evansella tamaricis TaxID=2069301 RepID=A0ABS6JNX5_9BACI|nr:Tad domain-containing protein [Evansella tamaricis]MBU9714008.1 Tad domain-containing protein [Evansella tamaricis]
MMNKLKSLFKKEQGNVIVLTSLAFTALIGLTGLVIDGGSLYMTKTHLQKVANATALSGAQELTGETETIKKIVDDVLNSHHEIASLEQLEIENHSITVELKKPVHFNFITLFGFDTLDVRAQATARLGTMGRAYGAAPLGIDESIPLEYGVIYDLKVDEQGVNIGNFGILRLEGPGAQVYEDNLKYGFDGELKVGDIVYTQPGNIAGKTREAVDYLVTTCDSPEDRTCRRVLLIPVIKPQHKQGGSMPVEIKGFAYFYLTEQDSEDDKTVRGYFLERAGTGFEEPGASNKGAYTIRLSE